MISTEIARLDSVINAFMDSLTDIPEPLLSAMKYAVKDGGKRLRPLMVHIGASLREYSKDDIDVIAIAIELIHSYSLVHDDMPAIDNDELRRGKPSAHIKFGEGIALIAGDALLNLAYEILLKLSVMRPEYLKAAEFISCKAGVKGMIGGQCMDITNNLTDIDGILTMYSLKTSSLFAAALVGGAIAAGANAYEIKALEEFSNCLGIAFQLSDDILDIVGNERILGKKTGSDIINNKRTVASVIGIEKSLKLKSGYEKKAFDIADKLNNRHELINMLNLLEKREK